MITALCVLRTIAFAKPKIDDEGVLALDLKGTRVIGKRLRIKLGVPELRSAGVAEFKNP